MIRALNIQFRPHVPILAPPGLSAGRVAFVTSVEHQVEVVTCWKTARVKRRVEFRFEHHPHWVSLKGHGYFKRLGPGIVTGAADDDPSGIGTYSQLGAAQGLSCYGWCRWPGSTVIACMGDTMTRL